MTLVLMRHGIANEVSQDSLKGLSSKGIIKVKEAANQLYATDLKLDAIWHSPKERAKQTALIIAKNDKHSPSLVEREELVPNAAPEIIYHEINSSRQVICLVSHLPLLDELTSLLLFGHTHDTCLSFGCGTIVTLTPFGERWHIERLIRP